MCVCGCVGREGGGGGVGVQKATISEGWGGSRSFQGAASAIGEIIKTKRFKLTVTLLLAGVSKLVLWMSILDGNILEDHGNSRGGGGLKQKCPQWGGEGGYGYFLELHMMMYCFLSWPLIISNFNLQPIKYISQIDILAQLFHYEILQLFLRRSFMGKTAQFSVRFI